MERTIPAEMEELATEASVFSRQFVATIVGGRVVNQAGIYHLARLMVELDDRLARGEAYPKRWRRARRQRHINKETAT